MDTEKMAVMYLGRALIAMIIIFGISVMGIIGYNTYFSFSKEKIEVSTDNTNSNSN